jgi:putative lysine transport system substrate-binding protein
MKKLLSLLLALVLVFGITACAPKAETPPADTASPSAPAPADGQPGDEKVLRVAMECAYAPYNWTQSTDANGAVPIYQSSDYAYGYDVMMAKYLAEKIGYKLEIHKMDWDSIPLAVQSGKVDVGICGQSITAERLETMDFTTPYYYASIVALTTADSPYANAKGLSELAGATCTSQINTVWYDECLPQIKDAKILPAMETTAAMLVALDSGKCNLVVTDEPTALAALMVYPNMKLLNFTNSEDNFEVSEEEINIGISLKKGNTELKDLLNEALATLTPDDFVRMMNEAIKVQPLSE